MNSKLAMALKPQDYDAAYLASMPLPEASNLSLSPILRCFDGHSLQAQSSVALMDRMDTKFILPINLLPTILDKLKAEYSILEMDERRIFTYETTYFDTPDRFFYLAHHNGKLNRNKVRYRRYVDTGTAFMEVKFKNNKGRTIKTRVPLDSANPDFSSVNQFVLESLADQIDELETTLFVRYQRITLMNKNGAERLTIDIDLNFKSAQTSSQVNLPKLCIAELKRERKANSSYFMNVIKQQKIYPSNFSKYCIGCALTDNGTLKANRFKPTLHSILQTTGNYT